MIGRIVDILSAFNGLGSIVTISEEGILFACKKNIAADKIFLYTTIRDSSGFFSFAALCSVEKLMYSGEYIIYKGVFFDVNFDTKDKIMIYSNLKEKC